MKVEQTSEGDLTQKVEQMSEGDLTQKSAANVVCKVKHAH